MSPATRAVDLGPLGTVRVEVVDGRLWSVGFTDAPTRDAGDDPVADDVAAWLRAFLDGPVAPLDVPRAPRGTPFQQRVWDAVAAIPWGHTRSYGDLATDLDASARAVGSANGANPLLLVVPCHRVVGADGALVGYAAGLDRKRWLLAHEGSGSGLLFGG